MWVQSSECFTMKEYNKFLWFNLQETLRFEGAMKLDLESCFDVYKLNVLDLMRGPLAWSRTRLKENPHFDLKKYEWALINNGILVNFRDDSLFWRSVSSVFSLSVLHFLIWEISIYRHLNSIQFGIFSQHLLRVELWI